VQKKILSVSFGILLALLGVIPVANATLITTGEIQVLTPITGRGNFSFLIGDISVNGFFDEGTRLLRPGFEGTSFDGNHNTSVAIDMFYGYVESQFVLWRGGTGPVFTSLSTTALGAVLMQGQTVYRSSFDFEGSLCGAFRTNTPCDVIFPSLTGQGIAEFVFDESVLDDGRHYFTPTKATYTFTAIPEPAPLALFCVGLIGIAFAKRRRLLGQAYSSASTS
jgi:hypothetical protein